VIAVTQGAAEIDEERPAGSGRLPARSLREKGLSTFFMSRLKHEPTPHTATREASHFAAFFALAHRAFCAAAIFALAFALNFLLRISATALSWAWWSRAYAATEPYSLKGSDLCFNCF
jgi:hypothetical protein